MRPRALALAVLLAAPAAAQTPVLGFELNRADPQSGACRMVFVLENRGLPAVAGLAGELVLFDRAGRVERLVMLDFRALPEGGMRVRSFDLPGLDCAALGRVLVNGFSQCSGEGLTPAACNRALVPSSRLPGVDLRG